MLPTRIATKDGQVLGGSADADVASLEDRCQIAQKLIEDLAGRRPIRRSVDKDDLLRARTPERKEFPPAVRFESVSAERFTADITGFGAILLRDVLDRGTVEMLVKSIDCTFEECDAWIHGPLEPAPGPWFQPLRPGDPALAMTRIWLRDGGGVFTADSPRVSREWTSTLHATGLFDLVAEAFGEPPVTSLTKGTLRRIDPSGGGIEWHQDGAFLGIDSAALNLWVSLSDTSRCRGLEIVDRSFADLVQTGTGGAKYDWSVGDEVVREITATAPVVRPRFLPGDALAFDARLLHRTAEQAGPLVRPRYAIETWFFRPSRFPDHEQVPIAL